MIKLSGAIMIILSCSICGYLIRFRYAKRLESLNNINSCLSVIENEIRYMQNDIEKAFLKTIHIANDLNNKIFTSFLEKLNSSNGGQLSGIWSDAVETVRINSYYIKPDIEKIKKFGNILGCGDIETQLNNITSFRQDLKAQIQSAEEKYRQTGGLVGKLGIYAGILITIIFW